MADNAQQPTEIKQAPAFVPARAGTTPSGIKVAMPKDPPKEVLESTFDTSGIPDSVEDIPVQQLPPNENKETVEVIKPVVEGQKQEPEKKEVAPTDETSKEEKKEAPKEEKKEVVKKPGTTFDDVVKLPEDKKKKEEVSQAAKVLASAKKQIAPPEKVVRDYSGYSPEQVRELKQMSDSAYRYTTDLIKQNQELQKLKDSSYLQHPQAYVLHPQFQQLQQDGYYAQQELQHWQEQLMQCKAGKPYKELVGYDKNGNAVLSEEKQPTPSAEEDLRLRIQQTVNGMQNINAQLQNIPKQFNQQMMQDLQAIEQEQKARFKWEEDPRYLDATLNLDGNDTPLRKIRQDFTSIFPPYLQNSIGVKVASNLFVAMIIQGQQLKAALSEQAVEQILEQEKQNQEPSSRLSPKTESPTNGKFGGIKEFSMEGMPEL